MFPFIRCAASAAAFLAVALPASAAVIVYEADLTSAAVFAPSFSTATGFTRVTLDEDLSTLRVQLEFSGLEGINTGAHLHLRGDPATPTGLVEIGRPTLDGLPLGVTSATYDHTYDLLDPTIYRPGFLAIAGGSAASAKALLSIKLALGLGYVDVHSAKYPGGEIRGDLVPRTDNPAPIPEPATWALMIAGFAFSGAALRRRYRLGRYATSTLPAVWPNCT